MLTVNPRLLSDHSRDKAAFLSVVADRITANLKADSKLIQLSHNKAGQVHGRRQLERRIARWRRTMSMRLALKFNNYKWSAH